MAALQSSTEGQPPKPPSRSFLDILSSPSSNFLHTRPATNYRGFPSVAFSADEITRFSAPFRHALIGKFSSGRPPMESIRKSFISMGFAGTYSLGLIDYRHILIKFNIEDDYVRAFLKRIYNIDGFTMRIFKWCPDFSVDSESAILPIWINFPLLPLHLFNKEALYSIARLIGEPLKLDASTAALTRPSVARVCVELDLRKVRPEKIWLVHGETGFWQPVVYENIPPLCSNCLKIGHQAEACRSTDSRPVPPAVGEFLKVPLTQKIRLEYRPKIASVQNLKFSTEKEKISHLPNVVEIPQPAECSNVEVAATEILKLRTSSSGSAENRSQAGSISKIVAETNAVQEGVSVSAFSLPPDLIAVSLFKDSATLPPKLANLVNFDMDLIASCQALELSTTGSTPSIIDNAAFSSCTPQTFDQSDTADELKSPLASLSDIPVQSHVVDAQPSADDSILATTSVQNANAIKQTQLSEAAVLNAEIARPFVQASAPSSGGVLNPLAPLFKPRVIPYAESSRSFVEALLGEQQPPSVSLKPHFLAVKSAEFPLFQLPQFGEFFPPSSLIPPAEADSLNSRADIYVFSDGDDVPRVPSSKQLLLASLQSFNKKLQTKFGKNQKFLHSSTTRKKWKKLPPISLPGPSLSLSVQPPLHSFSFFYGQNPNEEQSDDNENDNVWRSSSSEDESTNVFDYPLASIDALMALEYEDFSLSPPPRRKYNKRFRDLPPALPTRSSKTRE